MSRHTYKMFEHRWLFLYRHYTNVMRLCLPANLLVNLMSQNMYLMLHYHNLHSWHRMIHRLQIMARKTKLKILQNKSSRFVLGLAMDYMCVCVCVCVCRFLRVSADLSTFVNMLNIFFLLSLFRFFIPRPGRGGPRSGGEGCKSIVLFFTPFPAFGGTPPPGENFLSI